MLTLHKKNHSSSSSKKKSAFLGVFPPIIVKYYFKIFVRNAAAELAIRTPSTYPTSKHADAVQFELIDDHQLNTESLWLESCEIIRFQNHPFHMGRPMAIFIQLSHSSMNLLKIVAY